MRPSLGGARRVTDLGRAAEISARFPAEKSSAGAARRFVSQGLSEWGSQGLDDVALLLVSELAGNAIRHAGGEFEVRAAMSDTGLRVEVHDHSSRLPDRKFYPRTSTTGRGLMLVEQLSRAWGAYPSDGGKVVWFELDNSSSPEHAV